MLLELWLLVVEDFVIAYALWGHIEITTVWGMRELTEPKQMRQADWTVCLTRFKEKWKKWHNRIFISEFILHFNLSIARSALYSNSLNNCFAPSCPGDNKVKSLKMVSEPKARLNCAPGEDNDRSTLVCGKWYLGTMHPQLTKRACWEWKWNGNLTDEQGHSPALWTLSLVISIINECFCTFSVSTQFSLR